MQILNKISSFVWGTPTLLIILFTGIILSIKTKFFQIRFFKRAFKTFFGTDKKLAKKGQPTPLQAASTALAGTMGVGNIIGVAGAISLGGPGSVFWMWISAFFSMIVKFSEVALAVKYREQLPDGSYNGGAMYYIKNALPKIFSPLSTLFCVCGVAASFGIGNITQINTISTSVNQMIKAMTLITPFAEFHIKLGLGVLCAVICAVVLKNEGRVGSFCEKMMPVLTVTYIMLTLGAVLINYKKLPETVCNVFKGAFSPSGITGGVIGSGFIGMRFGIARGVFSNEAGMGTAPTAYACSEGDEESLGLMGIMEVFIDTVVVCTLTAFAILCSTQVQYGMDLSSTLTLVALKSVYGKAALFVFCPIVIFFAFSSVIGWGLYGTKFIEYLTDKKSKNVFLFFFAAVMIPAAVFRAETVWVVSEILNGIMIIPNTISLLMLNDEISDITQNIEKRKNPA